MPLEWKIFSEERYIRFCITTIPPATSLWDQFPGIPRNHIKMLAQMLSLSIYAPFKSIQIMQQKQNAQMDWKVKATKNQTFLSSHINWNLICVKSHIHPGKNTKQNIESWNSMKLIIPPEFHPRLQAVSQLR
jgi:hypothetical protein